jgi:hypothetical protein
MGMTDRRGGDRSLKGLLTNTPSKTLNDSTSKERDASMGRIGSQRGWNTSHLRSSDKGGKKR